MQRYASDISREKFQEILPKQLIPRALLHKSEVVLDVSCCDEKFPLKKATLQDDELV